MTRLGLIMAAAVMLGGVGALAGLAASRSPLPIVALPAVGAGDTLAVVYSGDGGWVAIDRGLSAGLVQAGIPVLGCDSLRYFWTARTARGAAADLTAVLRPYMAKWGKSRIILVGYSFGADALPQIVLKLPADLRNRIRLVALVGVEGDGQLEFHPSSWLKQREKPSIVLAKLKGVPEICIYGAREVGAACPVFAPRDIHAVRLAGGHHFDGDYTGVSRAILQSLPK